MQLQAFGPRRRRSLLSASLLLLLVAVTGFLVGQRRAPTTVNSEATREVSGGAVVLEYPVRSDWRPATPVSIAGLQITQPLALAPGGESQRAGLIVGNLAGDGRSLLPQAVLARLGSTPSTRIAHLDNMQAYRYSLPGAAGAGTAVTLYAIPDPLPSETVLACYAQASRAADLHTCERIAALARTTITLEAGENNLTPDTAYAHRVGAALTKIDALRASVRPRLQPQLTASSAAQLATALAEGIAKLGEPLGKAQPPRAAEWVQTQLVLAVGSMRHAYEALAGALEQRSAPAYALARRQVERAEGEVNRTLVNLALLGYGS
jgi:hypothetical protein